MFEPSGARDLSPFVQDEMALLHKMALLHNLEVLLDSHLLDEQEAAIARRAFAQLCGSTALVPEPRGHAHSNLCPCDLLSGLL